MKTSITKNKLAIFDFCDTLIDGQSVSLFLEFLREKQGFIKKNWLKLRSRFNAISSSDSLCYKNYRLKPYKGFSHDQLDEFAEEFFKQVLKKRVHQTVLERLIEHKKNKFTIIVVSGGFEIYLKKFAANFKVDKVLATKLAFRKDVFQGCIEGEECLGQKKIERLSKTINLDEYDLKNSFAYTDHESDIELLELVGNPCVVKKKWASALWCRPKWTIMNV
ncbi:HAD-IB family hydrolase [Candidatus Margulisiibacteriota bacterium]